MAFSTKNVNLKGCLFGPPSPKDYRAIFGETQVPDKVDLRKYCTPVENQGQLGSCTANATVGAIEYLYKKRDGQSPDLSRLFVYFNARRIRGTTYMDNGARICDAMASVLSFGVCREDIWPYNITAFMMEPSPQAYQEAQMHEAIQYSRVDGVDGAIPALASGFPVVFGTILPERCYMEAEKAGIISMPTDEEIANVQDGGHCMLIVGYDQPAKMFIVRNSWGEGWGDHGYCRIPFEAVRKSSRPEEFWIIGELAQPRNFSIIRPGKTAAQSVAAPNAPKADSLAEKATKMREEIRASIDAEIDASNRRIEKILSGKTGEKKAPRDPAPCPLCGGMGQGIDGGTCTKCGGVGFIGLFDKPMAGSGTGKDMPRGGKFGGYATCPMCSGSGKLGDGRSCPQCGGTGSISWSP
jgi:hypothetical protein